MRGGGRGRRGRRGGPGGEGGTDFMRADADAGPQLSEKVVFINRSAKVVKGGRRFSFSALVVVGDRQGNVGVGLGKAGEVAEAIRKGNDIARHHMVRVCLKEGTIPHEVQTRYCGAQVLLRPASEGTGVIAGKTVRAVLESAGVRNVLSKSLGSKNAANVVKATMSALQSLRLREDIYRSRGMAFKLVPKTEEAPPAPAPGAEASPETPSAPPEASA
ncbi:MAG: 30S ribosomal protein S5 [Verrucomicrobia bacterium]|nr:30S ribosomal protein S5 [Verrucomicrobiota bacterium]